MNVLIIAPHPDDEVIGCGGAVCLHVRQGNRVSAVFLTSGELGLKRLPREEAWRIREAEARKAAKMLGLEELFFLRQPDWMLGEHLVKVAAALRLVLEQEKPKLIYLPHPQDGHPDHQAALPVLKVALKRCRISKPELRAYEVWTPLAEFDQVEDITAVMPRKLRALRAHRSQLNEFDYERAVIGLNQFRGALAGRCRYAEVFQSIQLKAT
ncbi:MAG: PIG-L family deacetylase [Verrucomicrobia bacterium]|nr:PIG-L family deacetylase [Verrucomicrobiota bacterium]